MNKGHFCLISIGILMVFIASCGSHAIHASLTIQDTLTCKINKPIPHFCPALFFYAKNGRNYLFLDDKFNKEIRLFDLGLKKEIEPIPVHDTGANSIPVHFGFIIKDLDTIYLPSPFSLLFCLNRRGEIIKKIDFSALAKKYPLLTVGISLSRFTKGAVILGNDIYFLQKDSRRNYFSFKPSDYHFLFKYNVQNDSFGLSPISLPDNFWDKGKREMSVFMTYNNLQKDFVFGTMNSDKIYLSHDGKTITKTYQSKSKAIWKYYPYCAADDLNSNNYFYYLCRYSYNVGLLWDPYNKIYYRFVWPGIKNLEISQHDIINKIFNNFPTFVIEILDKDFNTLGSCKLPDNKYNWNNYFLTKEGLFLAVNTTPGDLQNLHWTFHLFKVHIH